MDANDQALDKKALKALGKTLKGVEKQLFNAITDTEHHVTIDTVHKNDSVLFGAFDGNEKNTLDFGDIDLLDSSKNKGGITAEQAVGH